MGLHRQEYKINWANGLVIVSGVWMGLKIAFRAFNLDAMGLHRLQVGAPGNQVDILSGQRQFSAQESADGPGSNDGDFQESNSSPRLKLEVR